MADQTRLAQITRFYIPWEGPGADPLREAFELAADVRLPALNAAIRHGRCDLVPQLLQRARGSGAARALAPDSFWTPLHEAAHVGCARCTAALLEEQHADVNAAAADGAMPMHLAAQGGHLACMAALAKHGAAVTALDSRGRMPWDVAASRGQVHAMLQLAACSGGEVYYSLHGMYDHYRRRVASGGRLLPVEAVLVTACNVQRMPSSSSPAKAFLCNAIMTCGLCMWLHLGVHDPYEMAVFALLVWQLAQIGVVAWSCSCLPPLLQACLVVFVRDVEGLYAVKDRVSEDRLDAMLAVLHGFGTMTAVLFSKSMHKYVALAGEPGLQSALHRLASLLNGPVWLDWAMPKSMELMLLPGMVHPRLLACVSNLVVFRALENLVRCLPGVPDEELRRVIPDLGAAVGAVREGSRSWSSAGFRTLLADSRRLMMHDSSTPLLHKVQHVAKIVYLARKHVVLLVRHPRLLQQQLQQPGAVLYYTMFVLVPMLSMLVDILAATPSPPDHETMQFIRVITLVDMLDMARGMAELPRAARQRLARGLITVLLPAILRLQKRTAAQFVPCLRACSQLAEVARLGPLVSAWLQGEADAAVARQLQRMAAATEAQLTTVFACLQLPGCQNPRCYRWPHQQEQSISSYLRNDSGVPIAITFCSEACVLDMSSMAPL